MCRLRRVGRRWIGSCGGSGGGYVVVWSTGRARSTLLGSVTTLFSDFSVYMAEVASDMTLHAESIDRKNVKRGMEDCE